VQLDRVAADLQNKKNELAVKILLKRGKNCFSETTDQQ